MSGHVITCPLEREQLDRAAILAALRKVSIAELFREAMTTHMPNFAVPWQPRNEIVVRLEISDELLSAAWAVATPCGRTAQDVFGLAVDHFISQQIIEARQHRGDDYELVDSHHRTLRYTERVAPKDLDRDAVERYNRLYADLHTLDGAGLGVTMPRSKTATAGTSAEVARQAEAQQRQEAARSAERERERQEQARYNARLAEILV